MSQKQESNVAASANANTNGKTTPKLFKSTCIDMTWGATEVRPMWQIFGFLQRHEQGNWDFTPDACVQLNREALASGGLVQSKWPIDYPDCSVVIATTHPDGETSITLDVESLAWNIGEAMSKRLPTQQEAEQESPQEPPSIPADARLGELHVTQAVLESNSYRYIASCIDEHACHRTGTAPRELIEYFAAANVRISQWQANSEAAERDKVVVLTFPGGQSRSMMKWEFKKVIAEHFGE